MPVEPRLHPDDIEAIALRVAGLMTQDASKAYLDAREVADRYGVSLDWVYEHKTELGAIPLGVGKRPRWRFPFAACEKYMLDQAEARAARHAPRPRGRVGRPRKDQRTPLGNPVRAIPRSVLPLPR